MKFDISALRGLQGKDLSGSGVLVLEGRIVIEKALDAGAEILGVLRGEDAESDWLESRRPGFPVEIVSNAELSALVGFKFHHGVLALARRPAVPPFDPTAWTGPAAAPEAREACFLCLWNVTDPSNVGALVRSAAGLGAWAVLLGPGCADPFYRKTLRASMGNVLSLPLFSCGLGELGAARAAGFSLAAATLSPRAAPLPGFEPGRPFVLVLGNEGFGLPPEAVELCGAEVYIPMRPGLDSLNVAAAGGILMYELFRRR